MEIAAIIFVLVMAGIAYIAFRILKRTVKLAIRAFVALLILTVAAAGGLALWNLDIQLKNKPSTTKKSR